MRTVSLLFSTSRNPLSGVIRAMTWSRWSHVGLIADGMVIESVPVAGVRRAPLLDAVDHAYRAELVELPCPDPESVIAAAISQEGKPFDYCGVLGMGLRHNWQDDRRWFCSELIAWSFAAAGCPLFRADAVSRVTPQHLWMLAPSRLSDNWDPTTSAIV